ncbi:DegT/DnrJ/EryC1/StrS family aminotransferase [Cecembia rubra]|uniref:dTDP-4-amino-4,6-dideoxygalactose transaminase n=1 Tax=Cecembia rubra TaxID=1485585 RepID=A0A2P8EA20_9BACT|nr:DegT/DnrJ/EryC1/StrS family aminotransferase [Cecembia rubra]PSL06323.1 dTDP-4-amino-4,6-dideoxygalactose transaminase [Cecembia rubra]
MKIPFSLPLIDSLVEKEIHSTLHETGWLTSGPKTKELEEKISELSDTNFTVCVNSWTSGALLLFKWLKLEPGDEIIVPSYTYAATALAVINSGLKCVYVDVKDDFTMDMDQVAQKITNKTKAIMPVDLGGLPADYSKLLSLLDSESVRSLFHPKTDFQKVIGRPLIIADAAHSIGAKINGRPASRFADFSIFSFHSVKNITTGEGGAITFKLFDEGKDFQIYRELKVLSLNGQTKTAFEKNQPGAWRYDIVDNGLKVNMPDINAAIGLSQIKRYEKDLLPERERIFEFYNSVFQGKEWAILPPMEVFGRKSSFHIYLLRIKGFNEEKRDRVITALGEKGIGVNVHYIPLPLLTYFKNSGLNISEFPVSYKLFENEISLPVYNGLSQESLKVICENLSDEVEKLIRK